MHRRRWWCGAAVGAGLALAVPVARGQESFLTDAATLPAPGRFVLREMGIYRGFGRDESGLGRRGYAVFSHTTLQYGLAPEWSLTLDVPVSYRDYRIRPELEAPQDHHHAGSVSNAARQSYRVTDLAVDDFTLTAKYRFLRMDTGPLDTLRAAVIFGVELPSGSVESSDSVDPVLGLAVTTIRGRHGLNVAASYKASTGGTAYPLLAGEGRPDLLRVGGSYLYRLHPAAFSTEQRAGLYAVIESINLYETSGDVEMLLAPGLMYEAPGFAVEVSVGLPVYQRLERRPRTDVMLGVGVRFIW